MAVHEENFQVSPEALTPGMEVNGWRIRERLGTGGFGVAYLVESTARPGEFFALKMARHLADERVGREIVLLLTRAVHPHVVRLHAFGRWPHPETGYLYFVMDWVQGLPLHLWAETHNPSIREAVEKLATVALTLEHLHVEGVLHRDLKPEHMLVRNTDGKPVLIDFGVGWYSGADNLTTQGMAPGTPHLRTPEAVAFWRKRGRRPGQRYTYKPTDDVYALGVSAYRVLTGHWPFPPHQDRDALFGAIESLLPPAPSAINGRLPRMVSDVILHMMAKRPQDRFPSCGEAHVSLVAALTFAGSEVVETELFPWEKTAEGQPPPEASERRILLPEWPTQPKTSVAPPVKQPVVPDAAQDQEPQEKHGDTGSQKEAPAEATEQVAPRKKVRTRRARRIRSWGLVFVALAGTVALARGSAPLQSVLRSVWERLQTHPTPGVGRESPALIGRKLALGPEWPEPSWAAVPLWDPTPAVVVATTNPEVVSTVNIQKVNQTTGHQAPEISEEKPARNVLESAARKALAAATACTLLGGCAGLPPLPPTGVSCPRQALDNMRALNLYMMPILPYEYLSQPDEMIPVREAESFSWFTPGPGRTKVPQGSQFIGRLWVRDRLYMRVERIVTPDNKEYAVCMELIHNEDIPATHSEPSKQNFAEGLDFMKPSTEPGVGYVNAAKLWFRPTGTWGNPNYILHDLSR
jgi:serine/threonine protein kinase